jgi:hypothetical protein
MSETVSREVLCDGRLVVTRSVIRVGLLLNDPARGNAVDEVVLGTLADRVADMAEDSQVRVVTLSGAGTSFCSGAELNAEQAENCGRLSRVEGTGQSGWPVTKPSLTRAGKQPRTQARAEPTQRQERREARDHMARAYERDLRASFRTQRRHSATIQSQGRGCRLVKAVAWPRSEARSGRASCCRRRRTGRP